MVQLSYIENVDFFFFFGFCNCEFITVFICAGDASVMPDVSISLVVNTIEGIIFSTLTSRFSHELIIKIPPKPII